MKKITKRVVKKVAPLSYYTGYLGNIFNIAEYPEVIDKLTNKIKTFQKTHPFEAIAFTGTSGSAVAFTLSYKLKVPLICIRKSTTSSHFKHTYEGVENVKKYIIVDDFISSGDTIDTIKEKVLTRSKRAKLVGIFLYGKYVSRTRFKTVPVYKIL